VGCEPPIESAGKSAAKACLALDTVLAVLRFDRNRRIDDPCEYARPAAQASPLLGKATVEVPRTHTQKARLYSLRWRVKDMHLVMSS